MATMATPLPPAREIPMTFVASVKSWWEAGEKDSAASEERLLRTLPFFQSDTWPKTSTELPITATSMRVPLSNPKRFINTLSITHNTPSPTAPPPAVLLHGYGAGLGFFFRNLPALGGWVARTGGAAHALDWLGMGRSARVPFAVRARRGDTPARVREAEAFFVDALEEWRAAQGVERMALVAHSLGAYLAVAYALRHPARVSRLVLLSPAGVPRDPDAAVLEREFTDDQDAIAGAGAAAAGGAGGAEPASKERVKQMKKHLKQEKRGQSRSARLFNYLWEEGWSPFQVIRTLSVFGPLLVGKYSARRFSGLTEEETRDMNNYILNITLAKGSGEYCISHLLAPFAQARLPLVDRIEPIKVPVTFVYGDQDWMDPAGGADSVHKLREAGNRHAKMYIIENAGHHLYLDNPRAVNDLLVKELSKP